MCLCLCVSHDGNFWDTHYPTDVYVCVCLFVSQDGSLWDTHYPNDFGIPIIQLCMCVYVYVCHKTGAFGILIILLICVCVYVYVCMYMCLFVSHDWSFWDTNYPTDLGIPIIQLCMCVYVYVCHKTGAFGIPIIQLIHENLTASAAPSDAAKNKVELPKSQHATRFTI